MGSDGILIGCDIEASSEGIKIVATGSGKTIIFGNTILPSGELT